MPLKYFDAKSKLNFTITNDRQNLYICVRAADDVSQVKILRSGMEIALDTSAKKHFPFQLYFHCPVVSGQKNSGKKTGRISLIFQKKKRRYKA